MWLGFASVVLFLSTIAAALADDQRATPRPQSTPKELTFPHPFCRDGKWGYIDNHGGILIEPQFDYAGPFTEGLAPARMGEKAGYLRTDGSWQIELPRRISPTRSFHEGRTSR